MSAAVETIQARVARWFADEPPVMVDLARATVPVLVAARPRFVDDTVLNPTPLAWLTAALDVLDTWPEPLPVPPGTTLAWRYLLFLRVACEALEAAYDQVWQQGLATHCPLADKPDSQAAPRPLRPPRGRLPPSSAGLGALLVGLRVPEAGQQCVYAAMAAGVDWVHPTAFWAGFGTTPASRSEPERLPEPATAPEPVASTPTPVATPPPDVSPSASTEDPLTAIVRATLTAWIAGPRFNRQSGDGWRTDALHVAAKPFAEALQAHAWVAAQPELSNRKVLYRRLAERGLILPHGGQRVWTLFVTERGQADARYVSALKLAPSLYAGLELGLAFQGTVELARTRQKVRGHG